MAKRIRPITLDASLEDGYSITMWSMVKEKLQAKDIDPKMCLYRGIDAKNIPQLIRTGQDNEGSRIYCSTFEDIELRESGEQVESAIDYANAHSPGGLLVYNPELLIARSNAQYSYEYRFKGSTPVEKLEALLAVFKWAHNFVR